MSIFKCNRCPYSTASQWLLKEHEFTDHAQNIKIDPKNPKAPTTVSFGPNVAKAPTSVHVSHSVQRGYGVQCSHYGPHLRKKSEFGLFGPNWSENGPNLH